jgi:hypothetical protein
MFIMAFKIIDNIIGAGVLWSVSYLYHIFICIWVGHVS